MADFDTLESSLEESHPLELYTFTLGSDVFRYTSAEDDITIGSDTWTAEAISRNTVSQGADGNRRNLLVTVPSGNAVAALYVDVPPGVKGSLLIWRLQRDEVPSFDTQTLTFKGHVFDVKYPKNGHIAEIVVRSIEAALSRSLPRFSFMFSCNHILYSPGCGIDPTLFDVTGAVTDETGNTITVTGATIQPDGFYTGGYCKPVGTTDFRLIIDHTGDVLTLLLPFAVPVLSTDVQVFAGCDHLIEGDCATKFDNVAEYGGHAFVPDKNVFETGL